MSRQGFPLRRLNKNVTPLHKPMAKNIGYIPTYVINLHAFFKCDTALLCLEKLVQVQAWVNLNWYGPVMDLHLYLCGPNPDMP